MTYKVIDTFPVGENTSVTIEGRGENLKNGITILDAEGCTYQLLSVAMISAQGVDEMNKTTTILLKGTFDSNVVSF